MPVSAPIESLQEIEQRSLACAADLAQQTSVRVEWRGVGFKLGGQELVSPMSNIVEILKPLVYTHIPKSKSWFEGIANVRGALIPIVNLHEFIFGERKPITTDSRIIVFRWTNSLSGLLVPSVSGIRNFYMDEQVDEVPSGLDEHLVPYIDKSFSRADEHWAIFEFQKLGDTERFLHISESEIAA